MKLTTNDRPAIKNAAELMSILAVRLVQHVPTKVIPVKFGKFDDEIPKIGTHRAARLDHCGFVI